MKIDATPAEILQLIHHEIPPQMREQLNPTHCQKCAEGMVDVLQTVGQAPTKDLG